MCIWRAAAFRKELGGGGSGTDVTKWIDVLGGSSFFLVSLVSSVMLEFGPQLRLNMESRLYSVRKGDDDVEWSEWSGGVDPVSAV